MWVPGVSYLASVVWPAGITTSQVQVSNTHSLKFSACFRRAPNQESAMRGWSVIAPPSAISRCVFVLPEAFGARSLGQMAVSCVFSHPELQGVSAVLDAGQREDAKLPLYGSPLWPFTPSTEK